MMGTSGALSSTIALSKRARKRRQQIAPRSRPVPPPCRGWFPTWFGRHSPRERGCRQFAGGLSSENELPESQAGRRVIEPSCPCAGPPSARIESSASLSTCFKLLYPEVAVRPRARGIHIPHGGKRARYRITAKKHTNHVCRSLAESRLRACTGRLSAGRAPRQKAQLLPVHPQPRRPSSRINVSPPGPQERGYPADPQLPPPANPSPTARCRWTVACPGRIVLFDNGTAPNHAHRRLSPRSQRIPKRLRAEASRDAR